MNKDLFKKELEKELKILEELIATGNIKIKDNLSKNKEKKRLEQEKDSFEQNNTIEKVIKDELETDLIKKEKTKKEIEEQEILSIYNQVNKKKDTATFYTPIKLDVFRDFQRYSENPIVKELRKLSVDKLNRKVDLKNFYSSSNDIKFYKFIN